MNLIKGNGRKYAYFVLLSVLAALGNMSIIYIVNKIIASYFTSTPFPVVSYVTYFFGALLLFFTSRWLVSVSIIDFTQKQLRKAKLEILRVILRSSYLRLMANKEVIFTAMTRDSANIVNASVSLVDVLTSSVVIIICFIYMGAISLKLLLFVMGLLVFTIFVYVTSEKKARTLFSKAMIQDDRFVKYLNEILLGFKEIIVEGKKGRGIIQKHLHPAIDTSVSLNKKALVHYLNNRIIGQISFYLFIGFLMFFLGQYLGILKEKLVSFVFLVLYIWGPIETLVMLVPGLAQANSSLKRLDKLQENMIRDQLDVVAVESPGTFNRIMMKGITYSFETTNDESPFSVGPIDFELTAGEVVFISGGNGSGKTTFINLMIGLFAYKEGEIYLDGVKIEREGAALFRSLFAPVFSDFHLFDECYGVDNLDVEKAEEYLRVFELSGKVDISAGKFNTIDLSTGQRKRLALISAMLERKPILVLDEFAADQDPQFRKKFYHDILGFIKREGFTVIAITHDDYYYKYCDTIYHMSNGLLTRGNTFSVNGDENVLYDAGVF